MTATLAQIRTGIAANLSTVFGTSWNVSAYLLANATLPAIDILPGEITYDQAMGDGAHEVMLKVRARVQVTEDQVMQQALDALIDPSSSTSLKKAVESDKTLGGAVAWAHVAGCSDYRLYGLDNSPGALGVEFDVKVQT